MPRTMNSSIEDDSSSETIDDGATDAGRLANGFTAVVVVVVVADGFATTVGATLIGMYLVGTVIKIGVLMMIVTAF